MAVTRLGSIRSCSSSSLVGDDGVPPLGCSPPGGCFLSLHGVVGLDCWLPWLCWKFEMRLLMWVCGCCWMNWLNSGGVWWDDDDDDDDGAGGLTAPAPLPLLLKFFTLFLPSFPVSMRLASYSTTLLVSLPPAWCLCLLGARFGSALGHLSTLFMLRLPADVQLQGSLDCCLLKGS